jgi:hypothetical protein
MAKLIPAVKALQGPASEQFGDVTGDFTTFLELALQLAPGLSDAAMGPLLKVIRPALTMPVTAVQKKAYKAFAYLCMDRYEPRAFRVPVVTSVVPPLISWTAPGASRVLVVHSRVVTPLHSSDSKDLMCV